MTTAVNLLITSPGATNRRKPVGVGDSRIDAAEKHTAAFRARPSCLCYFDEFDTTDTKSGSNGLGRPCPATLRIVGRIAIIGVLRGKDLPRHHRAEGCTGNEIFKSRCIGSTRVLTRTRGCVKDL
jgi:hypothetical protein